MPRPEELDTQNPTRDITGSKTHPIHPIWRGIGFALIVLTPIMGFATSIILLEQNNKNRWYPVPGDLIVAGRDPYLLIKILITLVISLLIFLIFQILTFFIFRVTGPSRYGPTDVPPVRYTGKKFKR